jgi:predicted transcriptional regulator
LQRRYTFYHKIDIEYFDGYEYIRMQRNDKHSLRLFMSKTITLRLSEENYKVFRKLADRDNRPISNFIETAVKRFIEHNVFVDEFEMEEIRNNTELNKSLKRGLADMKSKKGRFVE